ncbi:unnamed protein product [Caenorhabditis auriculariae]|uniref:Uncharacterized protein n=1 Tax=Caenorhabditis auriculariae TaxID=2777116 RepID=A0A8S1HRQ8_9PELO|nr:unnamed protein product [Caenorhabditis auriculariae]
MEHSFNVLDSKRQEETHRKTTSQMGRPLPEEHQPSYSTLDNRGERQGRMEDVWSALTAKTDHQSIKVSK